MTFPDNIIEKITLSKYVVIYLAVVTIVSVEILMFSNSQLFTYFRTVPAVLSYILLMFLECLLLTRLNRILSNKFSPTRKWHSLLLITLLVLSSVSSGTFGGFIWWFLGGEELLTLISSLQNGALLGLTIVLVLLTGGAF